MSKFVFGAPSSGGGSSGLTLISTQTVSGSSTSNILFASIPQTYTHLQLIIQGNVLGSGNSLENLVLDFNGDGGTNYSWVYFGYGATPGNGTYANQNHALVGLITSLTAAGPENTYCDISIPNYTGTQFWKAWISNYIGVYQPVNGDQASGICNGEWQNTAAITSINVRLTSVHDFLPGTIASLYGRI